MIKILASSQMPQIISQLFVKWYAKEQPQVD